MKRVKRFNRMYLVVDVLLMAFIFVFAISAINESVCLSSYGERGVGCYQWITE